MVEALWWGSKNKGEVLWRGMKKRRSSGSGSEE